MQEEILAINEAYDEMNEKYIRLYADFENYRKNKSQEIDKLRNTAGKEMLLEFVGMYDDISRASREYPEDETLEGVVNMFKRTFKRLEVETYGKVGDTFNEDLHEAIFTDNIKDKPNNEITGVYCEGVKLKGELIRYAKVFVNKHEN